MCLKEHHYNHHLNNDHWKQVAELRPSCLTIEVQQSVLGTIEIFLTVFLPSPEKDEEKPLEQGQF